MYASGAEIYKSALFLSTTKSHALHRRALAYRMRIECLLASDDDTKTDNSLFLSSRPLICSPFDLLWLPHCVRFSFATGTGTLVDTAASLQRRLAYSVSPE